MGQPYLKRVKTNIPIQANAKEFILTSQKLASHNISQALVENDTKVCIDAIKGSSIASSWSIQVQCLDTTKLAAFYQSIHQFKWTLREAN